MSNVDTINSGTVEPATSPAETVERLMPIVENTKPVEAVNIYKECLTPECDC